MDTLFGRDRFHIIIIGTGGTGGHLATRLSQFLAGVNRERYVLSFIDGDHIERKNLTRQPFVEADIQRNKAETMARVLSETFNLNIRYVSEYINSCKDIEKYLDSSERLYGSAYRHVPVICGCVDNMQARQSMHEFFEKTKTCVYIDSGNEYSYGEVVFGAKKNGKIISPDKTYYFPDMFEGVDLTPRDEISCESQNSTSAPQHMVTNVMAANVMMTGLADLLTEGTLPSGIVHFDSFKYFMRQDEYVPPREELRVRNVLGGE